MENDIKPELGNSSDNQDESQNQNSFLAEGKVAKNKSRRNTVIIIILFFVVIAAAIAAVYFFALPDASEQKLKKTVQKVYQPQAVSASSFATYEPISVDINPQIPTYSVDSNLNNIINASDFVFSDQAKDMLVKNSFVVMPGYNSEFFPIYEANRYDYVPNFITTDSILHNYHLMFDFLLEQLEEQKLIPELKQLNSAMLSTALGQYDQLKGTEWENAAKTNVGFFTVASVVLDPSINIPSIVKDEVEEELKLIEQHQGIDKSPVMNINFKDNDINIPTPQGELPLEALKEDYSQYVPRGHYDRTEALKAYFKSMMWYGRLSFQFKNPDKIKSAMLISLSLDQDKNYTSWNKIYEPINFFVGKSDDITYYQLKDILTQIYGQELDLNSVIKDKQKFSSFIEAVKTLPSPQINSMPIFEAAITEDREDEIKAFRFMGQRFTIDASIFQRLLYREVGDKTKSCSEYKPDQTGCLSGARCLPTALDIPATLGSSQAKNILNQIGENQYACYLENMSKMSQYISSLDTDTWTQNLYWGWLYQLRPLLDQVSGGYPSFMSTSAWAKKDLNTFLGSWTELKHDTILYAKQAYAELGAGPGPEKKDDRGYVEPRPYLYARLASLLRMTSQGLGIRDLLTESMKQNLDKMEQLAISLKQISEKELNQKKISDSDYELIRSYGGQLEHFWLEVNKDKPEFKQSTSRRDYLYENPAAIVADVATDPNGYVLEEGTGNINTIYVVVPIDGQLRIAKGGVYSYYEFSWPMADRLTDKKWRELLRSDKAPDSPEWSRDFIAN